MKVTLRKPSKGKHKIYATYAGSDPGGRVHVAEGDPQGHQEVTSTGSVATAALPKIEEADPEPLLPGHPSLYVANRRDSA